MTAQSDLMSSFADVMMTPREVWYEEKEDIEGGKRGREMGERIFSWTRLCTTI